MIRLTASSLGRVAACPASAVLPRVEETNVWAASGTAKHNFLLDCALLGREAALDRVTDPSLRDACEAIDLAKLPVDPKAFAAEVSFAFDLETGKGRELGRGLNRNYDGATPNEIVGTADVVGLTEDEVYLPDFKTGSATYLGEAKASAQLRFLALAAARAYGKHKARVALVHIGYNGRPTYDEATFDAFELDGIEDEVRAVYGRVRDALKVLGEGKVPDVSMGAHCKWCPAMRSCPAQVSLVRAVTQTPEQFEAQLFGSLTHENAGQAYQVLVRAESLLEKLRKAISAMAEQAPIQIGNGLALGAVESQRESLDGNIVHAVLLKKCGPDVAAAACSFEASKTSLKKALKPFAESMGQSAAELERRALEEIRKAGGVEVKKTVSVKEFKLRKVEAA